MLEYEDWYTLIAVYVRSAAFPSRKRHVLKKLKQHSRRNKTLSVALEDVKNSILLKEYAHFFE